jgi:methionyl-tRNA formyltransferase
MNNPDTIPSTIKSQFDPLAPVGTLLYCKENELLYVKCAGQTILACTSLKRESKANISARDFFNGYHLDQLNKGFKSFIAG